MTIAQVSKQFAISTDTLRYYERVGLIPPVPRTASGFRDYDEESCWWIHFILCMRNAGVQVDALVHYVELFQQGEGTREERKKILLEQRELLQRRIEGLQETLQFLDGKIQGYDQWNSVVEEQIKKGWSRP